MEFVVSRASGWPSEPQPNPRATQKDLTYIDYRTMPTIESAKEKHWFKDWYDRGTNHREENGMIACDRKELTTEWVIEIADLNDLLSLIEDEGDIILGNNSGYKEVPLSLEIYDDYRE